MNKKQLQLTIAATAGIGILTAGYFVHAKQNAFILLPQENQAYTLELGQAFPTDGNLFIDTDKTSESMKAADKKVEYTFTDDQLIKIDETTYPKVGAYDGIVIINNKEQAFKINVVDTTAPTLSLTSPKIELEYATDLTNYDWKQYLQIQDLSNTEVTVEANVDPSKAGTYKVTYTVKDASDNQQTIELEVIVKEKVVVQQTTPAKKPTSTKKPSSQNKPSSNSNASSSNTSSGDIYLKPGMSFEDEWHYSGSDRDGDYYQGNVIYY